jgi:hypothetical protein
MSNIFFGDQVNGDKYHQSGDHNTFNVVRPDSGPRGRRDLLRVLYLTAAPHADRRVDHEVRRVLAAIRAATHRDMIQIEHAPAATGSDLLDGLTRLKPQVVQFSGHGSESALAFESGHDRQGPEQRITNAAFARALAAVDNPPVLVVLNAYRSEVQLRELLRAVPIAIGMSDRIQDDEALTFAARFYRSVAEGESVGGAYGLAKTEMDFDGQRAHLPILIHDPAVDPATVKLVSRLG